MCGHVAHSKCHRDWFCSDSSSDDGSNGDEALCEKECPAGCGCRCMDYAEDGFGFIVPPPMPPPINLPIPMVLSKQPFTLVGNKRISASDDQCRSGLGGTGGNYLGLDEDYFEDKMMGQEDEYDEEDEGIFGGEEEEDGTMFELHNSMVHISEY